MPLFYRSQLLFLTTASRPDRKTTGVATAENNGVMTLLNPNMETKYSVRLLLQSVLLPHVFPNIHEYISSQSFDGVEVDVLEGQYTGTELATQLTSEWNDEFPGEVTVTFVDGPQTRFEITSTAARNWTATLEFWDVLGFQELVTRTTTASGTSGTLAVPIGVLNGSTPHLGGPSFMFLQFKRIARANMVDLESGENKSVMAMIPLCDVPYGHVKNFRAVHPDIDEIDFHPEEHLNTFDMEILDEYYRPRSIPGNVKVQVVLKSYKTTDTGRGYLGVGGRH